MLLMTDAKKVTVSTIIITTVFTVIFIASSGVMIPLVAIRYLLH